jgi:hypothetical protein
MQCSSFNILRHLKMAIQGRNVLKVKVEEKKQFAALLADCVIHRRAQ